MRFDPQVRIGLVGWPNGLLMAAQVEVTGDDERRQCLGAAPMERPLARLRLISYSGEALRLLTLRSRLSKNRPVPRAGLIEVERLVDVQPKKARLLMADDNLVGFETESRSRLPGGPRLTESTSTIQVRLGKQTYLAPHALVCTFDAECANP